MSFDESYWTKRYLNHETAWDIGYASPPLMQYLDQLENKNVRILLPGAGHGYEAKAAFEKGFVRTHVLDFSSSPLDQLKKSVPGFPVSNIHLGDFFHHKGSYDLILEQTFFCALNPVQREDYVIKMKELLTVGGKLVGVFFNRQFPFDGPPFGGKKSDYLSLFKNHFTIECCEVCYNSIPERKNSELFMIMSRIQ